MRAIRIFGGSFIGLVVACATVFVAPAAAITQGTGLSGSVGRPGTQWSSALSVNPGETVNVLIQYTNKTSAAGKQQHITITDTLPQGATFANGSAYLYTPAAPNGVKQADTLTTTGISTGTLKAGETAYIQFELFIPGSTQIACGTSNLVNKISAINQAGTKTYAAQNTIAVTKQCPATTPATTTTTTSSPTTTTTNTTTTTSTTPATTTSTTPATTTSTSTSTTPTTTTTTSTAKLSTPSDSDNTPQTLVNTGSKSGSILGIFVAAALVGVALYRFALPRLRA